MDDVFNEQPEQEEKPAEEVQQVEQAAEQSTAEAETTSAQNTDKHVPLAALEAERGQRRDWKERALRYEGELKAMREALERNQGQQPANEQAQPQDPLQVMEQRFVNMTLHASERMARKTYGDEAVTKAYEKFQAAVARNPALYQQAMTNPDPWDFVVQEGQKLAMLEEIGTDPKAYRERLEAEIMAKLNPTQSTSPAPLNLPGSLAGARSAASRTAPAYTGPQPLGSLFNN